MHNYKGKSTKWYQGLYSCLVKAEIKYIAETGGDVVDYLSPYKPDQMLAYIKDIGFKVRREYDVEGARWLETTDGICICLEDGFVVKNGGSKCTT